MFLMLALVLCLSLLNVMIKNTASKSFMSIHLVTNKDMRKNLLEERNVF